MAEKKTASLAPRLGRPRTYTAAQLRRAVERYFRSIGKTRVVTEPVSNGCVDKYGHPVMEQKPVYGDDGKPVMAWQWLRAPTVSGLCRALGVHRSTWERWKDSEDLGEIVEWAGDVMRGYLEDELLSREGKNVRGVEFALSANYGVKETKAVEVRDLRELSDEELWEMAGLSGCEDED